MSVYQGKLLELLSVHNQDHSPYIKVRLVSAEQEAFYHWSIDSYTATELEAILQPDSAFKAFKYRLSFHTRCDFATGECSSYLTKTYRDHSEKVYFSCSETFGQHLSLIKQGEIPAEMQWLPQESGSTKVPLLSSLNKKTAHPTISVVPSAKIQPADCQKRVKIKRLALGRKQWLWVPAISALAIVLLFALIPSLLIHRDYRAGATAPLYSVDKQMSDILSASVNEKTTVTPILIPQSENKLKSADLHHASTGDRSFQDKLLPENDPIPENILAPVHELPIFELTKSVTYGLPSGKVALTFDDGPSKYTEKIVDLLKEHGAGATFFFVGKNIHKYPEAAKYAAQQGYSIGNHTMTHSDLTKLSEDRQREEIQQTNHAIEQLIYIQPKLFRPPYGANNDTTTTLINELEQKIVLWNVDPKDWQSRDADKIAMAVQKTDVDGSIILLHETEATLLALPRILTYLKQQHLELVSLY